MYSSSAIGSLRTTMMKMKVALIDRDLTSRARCSHDSLRAR